MNATELKEKDQIRERKSDDLTKLIKRQGKKVKMNEVCLTLKPSAN